MLGGTGGAGMQVGRTPLPVLGRPEGKKCPRGSPVATQELLVGLGPIVRELPSPLLLCKVLFPYTLLLGSTGLH